MDLTGKADDLIDVSVEDDSLLTSPATKEGGKFVFTQSPATSVRVPNPSASRESIEGCGESKEQLVSSKDVVNCQADKQSIMTNSAIEEEQPPLCEEDVQPKRKKRAAQFNLRKSLAWDQAFFTNEGVLNPVELSLLNKTFKKSNEAFLPSIEEEESVRSSLDSNSTLSGDILALETLEENLFTEPHTSNSVSFETVPTQSRLPPLPSAKILATEKRNTASNAPESPEKKASCGAQDSFTFKRSSSKTTEGLHKPSQQNDAFGTNCASTPTIATKKVSTGHKRMKYTHGNAVPVNGMRAITHRNTPSKAKENSGISGRSVTSVNSSTAEHCDSAKHSASSRTNIEIPKGVASGTADLSNNRILPKISSSQSFDGTPELVSSRVSNDLMISNSESVVASHNFHEQSTPKIGAGISTDSGFSQHGKQNHGLEKAIAVDLPIKSGSTISNSMIFTAKDPTNHKKNHGFEKGVAVDQPTKSGSATTGRSSMIFTTKDPPSKSVCARPVNLQSKPTGLRMPAPKHGFFDTEKVIRAPHPALQKRSSANHILPPKSMPRGPSGIPQGSRLKPPGVPLPHDHHDHPCYRGTVQSGISMASHLRPESALTSSIASIPVPHLQSQHKANLEGSGLGLLAHQKFGFSPIAQQGSHDQRSDQRQVFSGPSNAAALSSFSQVNQQNQKGTCSVVPKDQSELSFMHQKCNLQDVSPMCSEQKNANANANDTKMVPLIDTGKASNMSDISCLETHYRHRIAVVADATANSVSKLSQSEHMLYPTQGDVAKVSVEFDFEGTAEEVSSNGNTLSVNSNLLNSFDHGTVLKYVDGQKSSVDSTKTLTSSPVSFPVLDDIAEKENIVLGNEGRDIDSHRCISSGRKSVDDLNVQVQNIKNPDVRPFSEEWLSAMEHAGEEWLQMKSGPVQNSPTEKIVPQPGPWSPVRRYSQQIGPFDCTKYTNAAGTCGDCQDE